MRSRRLTRSMLDRTIAGVCGGIGQYLGIDSWWVRGALLIFSLFTLGTSAVIYAALWLLIPQQTIDELAAGDPAGKISVSAETLILMGLGITVLGIIFLSVSLGVLQGTRGDILLPFGVIGLGIVLLFQQLRRTA